MKQILIIININQRYIFEDGKLERMLTENGYVKDDIQYFYFKDYQGNNRAIADSNGNIGDLTAYYPYGTPFGAFSGNDPYKYSGKELDTMNGLNLYDFAARQQDPTLGIFTSQDPLAGDYPAISPYAYCAANPVLFTDPTGMYIKGTNGRRVTYSESRGWSKNASADVMRVGNAMRMTKTGTNVLNSMLSSKHPISIKIDKTTKGSKMGKTDTEIRIAKFNGKSKESFSKVDITIYENGIESYKKDLKDPTTTVDNNSEITQSNKLLDPTTDDMLNSIGVHEGVHATDKASNSTFSGSNTPETKPSLKEYNSIQELINKKKQK